MKVLLTGGLGFIGSHCVSHWLRNTNHQIVVLDALRHAGDPQRLLRLVGDLPESDVRGRVKILYHDLRAPIHGQLKRDIGPIDHVVNVASDSHVDRSIADPVPFIQNNVAIALHTLEFAREIKPLTFIQVSTDEVYGPALEDVCHTEVDLLKPSNPYSASKAAQEHIAYSYWRTYGIRLIISRTMNNFGRWQHPEKFVPMVVRRVLKGEVVDIHAKPIVNKPNPQNPNDWKSGSRVWLHAENHANAMSFLMDYGAWGYGDDSVDPLIVNVAGEVEVTNLDLALLVSDILNRDLRFRLVDFHSSRPGHDLRYSLDGAKLAGLGWKMPKTFSDSFKEAVLAIAKEVEG